MLPDAFCAADGLLHTTLGVLEEIHIDEAALTAEFERYLPVLLTTRLLTALVRAGMGREAALEVLAEPTRRAAQQAGGGDPIDLGGLLDEFAADDRVPISRGDLARLLTEPEQFTGTASQQTALVVKAAREIAERHPAAAAQPAEVRL